MFGLESWFLLAVGSAILIGFQSFVYKIVAVRHYDVSLINAYAGFISALSLIVVAFFYVENWHLSLYVLTLAFITALLYLVNNITRNISLQAIDTAIFFPIYKVIGPFLVIVSGVVLYAERFTWYEWGGLLLSVTVPLLLVSKVEEARQNNLWRGLKYLLITAIVGALAALSSKEIAITTDNIWLVVAVGDFFLALVSIGLFWFQNRDGNIIRKAQLETSTSLLHVAVWLGLLQGFAFALVMFAYTEGPIGIIYTISSLYILIPIVLSVIFYHEHWNARKIIAIVLSIAALGLLK